MRGSEPESPAGAGPRSQGPAGEPPVRQEVSDAEQASLNRIATVPNLLSSLRILLIPVFVALLLHHGTEGAGLLLLGAVVSTDWIDGFIARRTGQVSNLGKVLDPVADRLALATALVTLVVRNAFPLWAALLVLIRDGAILVVGGVLLLWMSVRIDVRWIGKTATFALMFGIPLVAWANFSLFLHGPARIVGWGSFWIGLVLYYASAVIYAFDIARAVSRAREERRLSSRGPGD